MTRCSSSTFFLARPKVPSWNDICEWNGQVGKAWMLVTVMSRVRTLFLASLRARLSLEFRSNSMTRRS